MSGAEPQAGFDEFDFIAEVLRPLTRGAPEALDLLDDAAVLPARPGFDSVITADALVEGVHFLPTDPPDLVARKLLRVNLSDLAAKGADPYGYFLTTCWPPHVSADQRRRFADGLRADGEAFDIRLLGGDTTRTEGPLTLGLTLLGWCPAGRTVLRSGARPGHRVLVSGPIGDGWLGLQAALGKLSEASHEDQAVLLDHYRRPRPRLDVAPLLREHAAAAADVSDGLIADAGHLARASRVALRLQLDLLPISDAAGRWLQRQADKGEGLAVLATGGDDYQVVCTAPPAAAQRLVQHADGAFTDIGEVVEGQGTRVFLGGAEVHLERTGWRHG